MQSNIESVAFLDIDGVLNGATFFKGRLLNGSSSSKLEFLVSQLDPTAVEILDKFVQQTDCKIVISSTWRLGNTIPMITAALNSAGFKSSDNIIGITPDLKILPRGVEIKKWLTDHLPFEFKKFVIFDDDSDMLLEQAPHFFQTDNWVGLTPTITYKAKRFLDSLK